MAMQTVTLPVGGNAAADVNGVIRDANADHVVTATVGEVSRDMTTITVVISGPDKAVSQVYALGSRQGVWW